MLASLVLATVGRSEDVGRCLHSLARQTDHDFEVLLVDQNADDRLVPWIDEVLALGLNLRHLRMERPSLSEARNLGIEKSNGEIIGFPDDDCWYEADVIAQLREAFSNANPIDGIVANWVEQSVDCKASQESTVLSYEAWRRFRGGHASSISLFFRSTLFRQLGGFDKRLGVGCWYGAGEETDFILRALASGAVIQRIPSARIHHLFGAPSSGSLRARSQHTRKRARGTGAIYAKHCLSPLIVGRGLLAPLVMPLLGNNGWGEILIGFWTVIGRLEGMACWGWRRS